MNQAGDIARQSSNRTALFLAGGSTGPVDDGSGLTTSSVLGRLICGRGIDERRLAMEMAGMNEGPVNDIEGEETAGP